MNTFILTWNPDRWEWAAGDYEKAIRVTTLGDKYIDKWAVGSRKSGIQPGDRAFLLRQKKERGIVASGYFTSEIWVGDHWDGSGRTTTYAYIEWDVIHPPTDRLPIEQINNEISQVTWDRFQGSGNQVSLEAASKLESLWKTHSKNVMFHTADEIDHDKSYPEGSALRVEVNRYERDPRIRTECIAHYGAICSVCLLKFSERYGPIGEGFIHVHHLKEISTLGDGKAINPIKDVRPVCPNCHAMLHKTKPPMSIDRLKAMLKGIHN